MGTEQGEVRVRFPRWKSDVAWKQLKSLSPTQGKKGDLRPRLGCATVMGDKVLSTYGSLPFLRLFLLYNRY